MSAANSCSSREQRVDVRVAIERRRVHGAVKSRHCASSQAARRSRSIGPSSARRPAEAGPAPTAAAPAHTLGRIGELRLEPGAEGLVEQPLGLRLGQDVKSGSTRASTGRSRRSSAQNPWIVLTCASSSAGERVVEPLLDVGIGRRRARSLLERLAQPQLQLARGLLGEGHRDDRCRLVGAPGREDPQDPLDELGRLAGSRGRLDDERGVEIVGDRVAASLIGEVGRSWLLLPSQRCRDRPACRRTSLRATRFSSCGPHTGRKSHQVHAPSAGAAGRKPSSIARSTISSASRPARRFASLIGIS